MIERILLYWDEDQIQTEHLEACFRDHSTQQLQKSDSHTSDFDNIILPDEGIDLNKISLDIVLKAYRKNKENQTLTARYLGISVRVLHTYLKRLNILKPN